MADLPPIGADLTLEMDNWDRNMRRALRSAADFDSAVERARDATSDLERTINSVDALIDLQVDDSEIIRAQATIAGLEGEDATVTIHAQMGDIDTALRTLEGLDDTITTTINVNDGELNDAKGKIDDIDTSNPTVNVNVNTSDQDLLDTLADLGGTVDLVVNIATTGANLAGGALGLLGVDELVATDEAAIRLQYTTGQVVENAEGIADALFLANWGESRAQILDYIGAATLLGVEAENMEAALTAAFQTSAITGFEMEETLRAQQSLVKNGLVPDFQTAGTVLAAAFQSGTNVGDDLLDTVNEYSSTFAALGFTSDQVLSALNSGLAAGADNTDRIADAIREFGIKAREGTDEFRTAIEDLDLTDVYESFLAGETTGADFFGQLTNELGQVKDLAEQTAIATATIGTQSEDFSVDVIANIEVDQDQLQAIEAATDSVDLIGTDLNSQIEEFSRFAETEIHEALRNAFDIQEFIDNAKLAIDGFFTTLESGGSIGEGIGIAIDILNIPMLEDFQQTLSTLVIGMLQAAKSVMGALGQDTGGLSSAITALSSEQFLVDIAVANDGDDIASAVQTAIDRGVATEDVYATLNEQMTAAFERGNIDAAAAIRDNLTGLGAAAAGEIDAETQRLIDLYNDLSSADMGQSDEDIANAVNAAAAILERPDLTAGFIANLANSLNTGLAPEQFAAMGTQAGDTFAAGLDAAINEKLAAGDLTGALDLAQQFGSPETIEAMRNVVSDTFTTAIDTADYSAAATLTDEIQGVLQTLQDEISLSTALGQGDSQATQDAIAEIERLQAGLELLQTVEIPPPISEEDAAAVAASNDTMASSTEDATERTTAAMQTQTDAVTESNTTRQESETQTADNVNEAGERVIETYSLTAEEIETLEQAAIKAFPAIDSAYAKMAANIIAQEAALIASLQRITAQIQATVGAIGTLPGNAGGGGAPITLPVPTQPGTTTPGGTWPSGNTAPGAGLPSPTGGGTAPTIPNTGQDMPIFIPGMSGGSSFDQSVTTVNINNVFYPASGAAMAQSGFAVAQAAKGF